MLGGAKLILFDLDGTLIDSANDIAFSANKILGEIGQKSFTTEEIRPLIGLPASEIFRSAGLGDREDLESVVARFREHLGDTGGSPSIVYPGVHETLDELSRRNLTLNVVTNKPTLLANLILERSELNQYFTYVQGAESIAPKPSPSGINRCMERANHSQSETVMIGDSHVDVLAAKAAGCKSVGVAYHEEIRQSLVDSDPDLLVVNLKDIL
jgi:2-phosphoglycolate phosphatase